MSVLVFVDHTQGSFKKKAFETVNYAVETAKRIGGGDVTAVVLGTVSNDELNQLGQYGATKILHLNDARLDNFSAKAYAKAITAAVQQSGAKVVVVSYNVSGKAVAGIVAAQLKAGLVSGAIDYPQTDNGFVVKKTVFSGKAFAHVKVTSDIKVISLVPNTFSPKKGEGTAAVEALNANLGDADFGITKVSEDVVKEKSH